VPAEANRFGRQAILNLQHFHLSAIATRKNDFAASFIDNQCPIVVGASQAGKDAKHGFRLIKISEVAGDANRCRVKIRYTIRLLRCTAPPADLAIDETMAVAKKDFVVSESRWTVGIDSFEDIEAICRGVRCKQTGL
jgi:hypothetical protein